MENKSELPESTATVSDWKELREKFFKEMEVEKDFYLSRLDFKSGGEWAFEWFNQNIITPQATKEVREVYLPVSVEDELPELEEFYICLLKSEGGAVYEEKCWWNGKYFSYPSANYSITVTHWLKKVSLSLPKGECISQDDLIKELEDRRIVNLMKEFDEKLPEEEKWKQPCQNIYYLSLKHTAEYLLDKFSASLPIKEIEENAEHWKGEAEHWFEEAHRLAKIIEGKEIEGG